MKLLSIISPIYNCEKTIHRLLDSIAIQRIDKNLIEVILCDDNSTDGWRAIADTYVSLLPIKFCKISQHKIHCPGNTRSDGLKYATGQWVTFIDNDDFYTNDAFIYVIDLLNDPSLYYISANVDEVSSDFKKHGVLDASNRVLLHGKFYRRSFLIENNIDFKENLYTMEDVHFNSQVFAHLQLRPDMDDRIRLVDEIVYEWVDRSDSLSHSYEQTHDDRFIDAHLGEYIYASTAPYLEMLEKYQISHIRDFSSYTTPLFVTVMSVYFRYQSGVYQIGHEIPDKNLQVISQYYYTISEMFDLDADGIVAVCLNDPEVYCVEFRSAVTSTGYFIPEETFRDFVRRMLA